jgi:hypothetical protein
MRNENFLVDIYVADLYDYRWDDVYGWHFWCVRMDETYVYVNGWDLCVCDVSVEWMRLLCMIVYMYNYLYMCDFPV